MAGMPIKPSILERLARIGTVLGRIAIVFAIIVNIVVLVPAAYFSLVLGDWPPTLIAVALSIAFWAGLFVGKSALRRWLTRCRILRVAQAEQAHERSLRA